MASVTPAGVIQPVAQKCAEMVKVFPSITQVWGYAEPPSDHANRRCVDYMVYGNKALGDAIANYNLTHATRLGLYGQIWYRRVMGFPHGSNPPYRGPWGVWREYTGTPNPHTDHIHVEYDGTAYVPPAAGTAVSGAAAKFASVAESSSDEYEGNPDVADLTPSGLWTMIQDLQGQIDSLKKVHKK
jgi:hypothetical protein